MIKSLKKINKSEVFNFIKDLYQGDSFSFSPQNKISNLYSTCFGVMCIDIIGETENFENFYNVAEKIISYQDKETGYFVDKTIILKKGKFDREYIYLQLTDFAQIALVSLGYKPKHKYEFLIKYKDFNYLNEWLKNLNWSNPWLVSNLIMFILNCFIHENEFTNKKYILYILSWLDKNQNKNNGYWNLGKGSSYFRQMAGAYHYLFFYTYMNRNMKYLQKVIDSTLNIQCEDGLFSYMGSGGSCDDLDAVDLLCRSSFYTSYRRNDIKKALYKTYISLLENQNEDGGFCWAKRKGISKRFLKSIFNLKLLRETSKYDYFESLKGNLINQCLLLFYPKMLAWRYSGLKSMQIKFNDSDLFSTWFRLTSIAFIEETFPEICGNEKSLDWNLRKKCGLGFYKK
jgi:hypothetical protein